MEDLAHLAEEYQRQRKIALEALGSYQKQGAISHNVGHMAEMLMDESDRGVVVILSSLLEDIILERLMGGFVRLDEKEEKSDAGRRVT